MNYETENQRENSWQDWSNHVLLQLKDHSSELKKISATNSDIRIEIATLKAKSGLWGLMGGLIPVAIAMILKLVEA